MSGRENKKADFKLFTAIWNCAQGQGTPHIHFRMADWLERAREQGDKKLLLMAFRASGKSTIAGLYAAWLLYIDPALRILVLAAEQALARKMVRNVKRIIERHPLTAPLQPEKIDQWGADRFTLLRDKELRDPSMLARGISANITGSRADVIIYDDVEVPKTCATAGRREELRARLRESDYVLSPGGTRLYIGTPHHWYTIYAHRPREEIGEQAPFLDGYGRLVIPLIDRNGQSAWPEKFDDETIADIRRSSGPNKFRSQMMLEAVNIAEGRLDVAALEFYSGRIERSAALNGLYLNGRRLIYCSAWWDPSLAKKGRDSSVLAILYTDEDGTYWLHQVKYIKTDPFDTEDPATQQCRQVAFAAQIGHVPVVHVESNGVGGAFPDILRREVSKMNVPCSVRPFANSRNKDERILDAFDSILAARMLHVHERIRNTPFIMEMQEWQPGRNGQRDDGLDAVAGALALSPVRLKYKRFSGRQDWQGGGTQHQADAEFEV